MAGAVRDRDPADRASQDQPSREGRVGGRGRGVRPHRGGAEPLFNPIGTAPGIGMRVGGSLVACLPGVPNEMKRMFDEQVVPWLVRSGIETRRIVHRKINLLGKGESEVEAEAFDLTARGRNPCSTRSVRRRGSG